MSNKTYMRVQRGHVTMANLKDQEKSLYITDLEEFYETEYKVIPKTNIKYACGKGLNRHVRSSLYTFLMHSLSKDGETEPKELSTKVLEKYSVDEFYERVIDLHGIGTKTAILATIAITGMAPSITKNLADQVCEAMFVSSDKTNLVAQNLNPVSYRGGDEYSTALDMSVVKGMVNKFCDTVLNECGFKKDKLPTLEELVKDVYGRLVKLPNGKVMLGSQYNNEQGMLKLCNMEAEALSIEDIEKEIAAESDGANIVTAGLDDYQYASVKMVVEGTSKVYTITGKAGTGKSHVISALHRMYHGQCVLTAYQNSACDVLSNRVGGYSFADKPIKSLIGLSMTLDANQKFAEAFRSVMLVIIDESSQIGTRHLEYVLNIMRHANPDAKLVMVGDILQTRPVLTYGMPFVHMVKNNHCPTTDLTMFHRTNGLGILALCEKIRAATNTTMLTIGKDSEGVSFTQGPHTARYWNEICTSIANDYSEAGDELTKCMTISENNADCNYINWLVTSKLFGDEVPSDFDVIKTRLPVIRKGMVVRSTINESGIEWKVTNGTRYYVEELDELSISLKDALGHIQHIPLLSVSRYDFHVAYAITVHKSQGNEADNVRYVFRRNRDFGNAFSCDKTMKYVAFSRARESLTLHEIYSPKENESEKIVLCLNDSKMYDMSI